MTPEDALPGIIADHQAGRLAEAEVACRKLLAARPDCAPALHRLGLLAAQAGQSDPAIALLQQAADLSPSTAFFHLHLGQIRADRREFQAALTSCRTALSLDPHGPEAHRLLGIVLYNLRQLPESVAAFREALRLDPQDAAACSNLGIVLYATGETEEALAAFRSAVRLRPDPGAWYSLATLLFVTRQYDEAIAAFRQALGLHPDFPEALNNLAATYHAAGRIDEAIATYRQSIARHPDYADPWNNLGIALKETGALDEAIASFRRAAQLRPDFHGALSNLIFTLPFHPACDAISLRNSQQEWQNRFAQPLASTITPHTNDRDPDRPLRIGYVSPDFREHCQVLYILPLFAAHDPKAVEVFAYSDVAAPDDFTRRLQRHCHHWRPISGLSDDQVASLIRTDKIDILIDLTMHMAGNRLLLFARKPAPIQVSWLAYPGTTGLRAIDYHITDPFLEPPDGESSAPDERAIRLPETFWCYDPLAEPDIQELPARTEGHITFGCLNSFFKVNDAVLGLWAEVLGSVRESRLLLSAAEGRHRARTLAFFQARGIARERIDLTPFRPRPEYLRLYHRIDIGLDTFPYNGHTTSLDSYWMGVPVVTLVGKTPVGRAGLSQLSNLNHPEWIATTPEQYVAIASALAGDLPRLSALRSSLRETMRRSPLMGGPRFVRNLESLYRGMWRHWCAPSANAGAASHAP